MEGVGKVVPAGLSRGERVQIEHEHLFRDGRKIHLAERLCLYKEMIDSWQTRSSARSGKCRQKSKGDPRAAATISAGPIVHLGLSARNEVDVRKGNEPGGV
jgi:hypothetical protein